MPQAVTQSAAAPPDDPVRMALEDPALKDALLNHALAILSRRMADRPATDRLEKAKEACQETYARALQKRHDRDPLRSVFPWVHGIMNNVLFETVRSQRQMPVQELPDAAQWERLTANLESGSVQSVANRLDVDCYLAQLAAEHKEVLQLRFLDGLGHEEIAARLGISVGNARVRLYRALIAAKIVAGVDAKEDRP